MCLYRKNTVLLGYNKTSLQNCNKYFIFYSVYTWIQKQSTFGKFALYFNMPLKFRGTISTRIVISSVFFKFITRKCYVLQLAAKCYREVGDDARTFYLDKTIEMATHEGNGDIETGMFFINFYFTSSRSKNDEHSFSIV